MKSQQLDVKFREIMRRAQTRKWTIRFWFTQGETFSPASAYSAVLEFMRAYVAQCDMEGNASGVEQHILFHFRDSPLAAFEILDCDGNGLVTYVDW